MAHVLDNIRVLDFSRVFAGPDATQMLGDLGADVIKVEEPNGGDSCRYLGVTRDQLAAVGGVSPSFLAFNRNKRSIIVNLADPGGREVARRLADRADVIVNNFRPGVMARWGLGYDEVQRTNPGVIFCDFQAYGAEGSMAHVGANDLALQAHSGLMSITGEAGGPPVRCGSAVIDLHASLALVSGILAALLHRQRTGEGQRVEASLLLSSAHLMSYFYADYWLTGNLHRRMGTANHLSVPNQAFSTHDGHVVIIAPSDEMWQRCASALSPETLLSPAFATASERLRLREQMVAAITAVTMTMTMTKADVYARLSAVKVNVSIVQDIGEAADHPQLAEVGGVMPYDFAGRKGKGVGTPFRLHATPAEVRRPPPDLGEHTDEILREARYSAGDIERLRRSRAVGG